MSQSRLQDKLDSLFSKKFFFIPKEKAITSEVDFPLPESPDTLKTFFEDDSGQKYKKIFSEIVDDLVSWAKEQNLDPAVLIEFKKTYHEYSGSNKDANKINFPLYRQGIPGLSLVLKLIQSDAIPLDHRKDILKNLITDIEVCGPGCYRHIASAKVKLESYSEISKMLMELRKKIAEQVVIELIENLDIRKDLVLHYANAVLNYYSDELAIPMIEDDYIRLCTRNTFQKLLDQFSQIIPFKITAENIIELIITDLNLAELPKKLMQQGGADNLKNTLAFYGTENIFYDVMDITREDEEDILSCRLRYDANYIFFLSLFNRLKQSEYIDQINIESVPKKLTDSSTLYYFPTRSAKFAYVNTPNAEKEYQPFLSYCIEKFLSEGNADQLIAFIKSELPVEIQFNIVNAISQYLRSTEFNTADNKDKQLDRLINLIPLIYPITRHWEIILEKLPIEGAKLFFDILKSDNQNLLNATNNKGTAQIFKFFDLLSKDEQTAYLKKIIEKQYGDISLWVAAREGYAPIVQSLLVEGTSPNVHTGRDYNDTPLISAINGGHLEAVKMLLEDYRTDPNFRNRQNQHPLLIAAQRGDLEIVKLLLLAGANLKEVDKDNETALALAAKNNHLEVVEELLAAGANVNSLNIRNKTPLSWAAEKGYDKIVHVLLNANAEPNIANETKATPLAFAAQNGHLEVVKALLAKKANPDMDNIHNITPLLLAAKNGHLEIVKALLDAPANPNTGTDNKTTPLLFAAQRGDLKMVQALLGKGADPNIANDDELTPLLLAAQNGHHEIVNLLLGAGADPNVFDKDKDTALSLAARKGHLLVVQALLEVNANPDIANKDNARPLSFAAQNGHLEIVKLLLHKANINVTGLANLTKLMEFATHRNRENEVKSLFKNCKNKKIPDYSPLHAAVLSGNKQIVNALLEKGIDANKKMEGVSALQLAHAMNYPEIVVILVRKTLFNELDLLAELQEQPHTPRDKALKQLYEMYERSNSNEEQASLQEASYSFLELDTFAQQLLLITSTHSTDRKQRLEALHKIKVAVDNAYQDYAKDGSNKEVLKRLKETVYEISHETRKDQAQKMAYKLFGKQSKLLKELEEIIQPEVENNKLRL